MAENEIGAKALTNLEFGPDDALGEVKAIVATLGVVDRDSDVIALDAIDSPTSVLMSSYGHSAILAHMKGSGVPVEPPVGKGSITVVGDKAIFQGRYFMETQRGREAYLTAKAMGADQEWSFGYFIAKADQPTPELRQLGAKRLLSRLLPFEASPVTLGGGVGTGTLAIKALDDAAPAAVVPDPVEVARLEAEAKVKAETDEAEAKQRDAAAQKDAEAKAASLRVAATEEFDRFQRNMRRLGR